MAQSARFNPAIVALAILLFAASCPTETSARFKLIKQWVPTATLESGYYVPGPGWQLKDGSTFVYDNSGLTPYPFWRLRGATLTPVSGFAPEEGSFQPTEIFNVGETVVLSGRIGGVSKHWRIDGTNAIPLEPEFGPVPFHSEWLWTPLASGTVISGRDDAHGRELWWMDASGYTLIADLNDGPADSHPGDGGWDVVPIYDWPGLSPGGTQAHVLFTLNDGSTGAEPWVFDTEQGTLTLLGDLIEGPDSSGSRWLGTLGDTHYFGTIEHQLYKSDGVSLNSLQHGAGIWTYGPYSSAHSAFELDGNLYPWWRPHGLDPYGYILRILPDDTIRKFRVRISPLHPDYSLDAVLPFDGAVQILSHDAPGGNSFKIVDDEVVRSDLFSELTLDPGVITWTENEMLLRETRGAERNDLFCFSGDEAVPVWRQPAKFDEGYTAVGARGDWIYIRVEDNLALVREPGGTVQLWGMKWPEGCQEAWLDNMQINAGLNDAWYNPSTPGQGFFITVFESIEMMFVAWFTYDTERPPGSVQAMLGAPGHRWLTAFGPYTGNLADLDVEITSGGVFDSANPAADQQLDGALQIDFGSCNSAVVTFDIPSAGLTGTIPIERIALDNVASCEALAAGAATSR